MKGKIYNGMYDVIMIIVWIEGVKGFFCGWVVNIFKVVL